MLDIDPPPLYAKTGGFEGKKVDRWQLLHFEAPSHVWLDAGVAAAGTGAPEGDRKEGITHILYDGITPETEDSTHYFWSFPRNYKIDSAELDEMLQVGIGNTFLEDKEMLEKAARADEGEARRTPRGHQRRRARGTGPAGGGEVIKAPEREPGGCRGVSDAPKNIEDALLARRLIRACDRAALGTVDGDGSPYTSLVLTACDPLGAPLLLMSDLAEHSKQIAAESAVSLLFEQSAGADAPLDTPRLSVAGRATPTEDSAVRARYLARHPDAELYADFGDFAFYRVTVDRAHLVAGFGRIRWIDAADLLPDPGAADLIAAEADIVGHMNDEHADAVDLYATRLLGREGDGWRMTGIDPDGGDLRLDGATARLDFDAQVTTSGEARATLVDLAKRARTGNG